MDKPVISIIVPCYNVEKYIDRAIQSAMQQSFAMDQVELILVDDKSTDATLTHLMQWEQQYPDRICVIACEENGRQGTARNIGVKASRGEWISFLDADDWLEPDFLEKMFFLVNKYDLDVAYCGVRRDDSEQLAFFTETKNGTNDLFAQVDDDAQRKQLIRLQCFGGAPAKLVKKEFLEKNDIWFAEGIAYEDLYFRELFHMYVKRGAVIGEDLYHYYVNPNSTCLKTNAEYHFDYLISIQRLWDEWQKRGFLNQYREELECEMLLAGYLQYLKVLALRFETAPCEQFRKLQRFIRDIIPNRNQNFYLNSYFSDKQRILLEAIDLDMSDEAIGSFLQTAGILLTS